LFLVYLGHGQRLSCCKRVIGTFSRCRCTNRKQCASENYLALFTHVPG
jgi:hypothetical protein